MPSQLELELNKKLKQYSQEQVTREVGLRLDDPTLSIDERKILLNYLLNSGAYSQIVQWFSRSIGKDPYFSWGHLLEALQVGGASIDSNLLYTCFEGAKQQNAMSELVQFKGLDREFPEIKSFRAEIDHFHVEQFKNRLNHLVEKLEFVRSNRLLEQEQEVLQELIALKPSEQSFKNQLESLILEKAKQRFENIQSTPSYDNFSRLSEELESLLKPIYESIEELIQASRIRLADACLFFLFIDEYKTGLRLIDESKEKGYQLTTSEQWLHCELLLKSNRHIECLDALTCLEAQDDSSGEMAFAITYLKAQCLYHLGHRSDAIDLLNSIVRIRPDYRSANTLLQDWEQYGQN